MDVPPRRAFRDVDLGYVGGVSAGLAEHLGLPVTWVRAGFIVATVPGGFGAAVYAALWILLPATPQFSDDAPGIAAATRQGRRSEASGRLRDLGVLVPVAVIAIGALLLIGQITGTGTRLWPLLFVGAAIAIGWRQADEAQRLRWRNHELINQPWALVTGGGGWRTVLRLAAGLGLLLIAIVVVASRTGSVTEAGNSLFAAVLGIVGLLVMVGPWLYRLSTDLSAERAERVRSQERADVAAHLHDSVLQTLALIQNSADDPSRVAQLARSQERDLRSWLFAESRQGADTVAAGLRQAGAEVEDAFGIPIEVVCVSDAALDERLEPVIAAAREAMTNAAKHSGAGKVDVYAEIGEASLSVFVRDRGKGFDPGTVPGDRQGLTNSIVNRMSRHGGRAEIRSTPGQGTEIRLFLEETA